MIEKIRSSLTLKLLMPTFLMLLLSFGGFMWTQTRLSEADALRMKLEDLGHVSLLLQSSLRHAMAKGDMATVTSVLKDLDSDKDLLGIHLADSGGKIKFSSKNERLGAILPDSSRYTGSEDPHQALRTLPDGRRFITSIASFKNEAECRKCHDAGATTIGYLGIEYSVEEHLAELGARQANVWLRGVAVLVAVGILLAVLVHLQVGRRLSAFTRFTRRAEQGDWSPEKGLEASADEVGALLGAFISLGEKLRYLLNQIKDSSTLLKQSADEMLGASVNVSGAAEETASQSVNISDAAQEVSKNSQSVASGVEEMNVSIREVARNAGEAAKVANEAVKVAQSTTATVSLLARSSQEIGDVLKVITDIAQKTNLLALNASIEAARAGEAGKGFAVVANEVKELAKGTARATDEVRQKISAIQTSTKSSDESIGRMSAIINQISDIQNTIASAMEEQAATVNSMSRSVGDTANGSAGIAQNISEVLKSCNRTSAEAAKSYEFASKIAEKAATLEELIKQSSKAV